MRTKQEYQEKLVEIENMLFDDESITLQLYRQCKNRLDILQELIDNYKEKENVE